MTAGEGEWFDVEEARAGARGAVDEGMRPVEVWFGRFVRSGGRWGL